MEYVPTAYHQRIVGEHDPDGDFYCYFNFTVCRRDIFNIYKTEYVSTMRRTSVIFAVTTLLSLVTVVLGSNCTGMFQGLGMCAVLNGVLATGSVDQLGRETLTLLDDTVMEDYIIDLHGQDTQGIQESMSCRQIYGDFNCIRLTQTRNRDGSYKFAAPCNGTGGRTLPCYEWCTEYIATCASRLPRSVKNDFCTQWSAPRGVACFGSNGLEGMAWYADKFSGTCSLARTNWGVGLLMLLVVSLVLER